ncbi:MAG: hypothetical protein Q4E17_07180 [Synergistes sp.]|nr:hypothetical protein [Synergistes sp.]
MNKKRIFTWLTLAAAVLCLGAFSYAGISKVGDTETYKVDNWASLLEVVSGAKSESGDVTVILSGDEDVFNASGDASLDISEDRAAITLDLNGKTLIMSGDTGRFGEGEEYAVVISNDGTLTIANGTIQVLSADDDTPLYAIHNTGKLTISGDVKISASGDYFASGDETSDITIKNGAQFYFATLASADAFKEAYLTASHQTVKSVEDSHTWYEVTSDDEVKNVTTSADLKRVLGDSYYSVVILAESYVGELPAVTVSSDARVKTLNLSNSGLTLSGTITVPASVDLLVFGAENIVSKDSDAIFDVQGTLTLDHGKYRTSGDYFTGNGRINLEVETTQFYFATDEAAEQFGDSAYVGSGRTMRKVAGETYWYEVAEKGEVKEVNTPAELGKALGDLDYSRVILSTGYTGKLAGKATVPVSGDKTLELKGKTLALSGDGQIVVAKGAAFGIDGLSKDSYVSKDKGAIFAVQGKLSLKGGNYYVGDGVYFTGSGDVEITNGTNFYFKDEKVRDAFIIAYLAEKNLTLEAVEVIKGMDGWYTVTTKEEPKPTPTPAPVKPVVSKDKLPEGVEPVTAGAWFPDVNEAVTLLRGSNFKAENLMQDGNGNVFVKRDVAEKAIVASGHAVKSTDIVSFPVIYTEGGAVKDGSTIMVSFAVSGDKLGATSEDKLINDKPSAVKLYKLLGSAEAERFTYVDSVSKAKDKAFTIQEMDGKDATKIAADKDYLVSVYILDGGNYDLDGDENGAIADPIVIDKSEDSASNNGSSVGCNAGFAALALLGLAFVPTRRKK